MIIISPVSATLNVHQERINKNPLSVLATAHCVGRLINSSNFQNIAFDFNQDQMFYNESNKIQFCLELLLELVKLLVLLSLSLNLTLLLLTLQFFL